jgi:tripartite-type tricarboxylate transporter receptor subunit TctC
MKKGGREMEKDHQAVRWGRIFVICFMTALVLGSMIGPVEGAEKYPNRPINLIVPYAPGGASDLASKIVADKIAEFLGQPLVSQYKPGGGGSLGASFVAKAKADGYTILVGSSTPLVLSPIVKKMDFKLEDFIPLGIYGETPIWVPVKKDAPWKTLQDLIAEAKSSPGKITVSSYGKLTAADFVIEMLSKQAQVQLNHVPYKATPEAISAVLGGHAQAAFVTGAGGLLDSGSIRILAAAADRRLEGLPEVPTFKEAGYPISLAASYTLCLPKGTPQAILEELSLAQKRALEKYGDEIKRGMTKVEVWANFLSPQETMVRFRKEYEMLHGVAKELGVLAK